MESETKATKKDRVMGALRMKGLTPKSFAERYEFSHKLVLVTIDRHYGGIYSSARGKDTKAIIEKLVEVTGEGPNEESKAA